MNQKTFWIGGLVLALACGIWMQSCHRRTRLQQQEAAVMEEAAKREFPPLGSRGAGPSYDKGSDSTLTSLIREVEPRFRQFTFHDIVSGKTIDYNLLLPDNLEAGKSYPLLLFMADASTPGRGVTAPLTQGYGALVWGTQQWQREHPCIVLVPQFSGIAVDDEFEKTPEVDATMRLLDNVANNYPVDRDRIYTTGQSMGGMISMYFLVTYPDVFAAAMPVDCHWDFSTFDRLAHSRLIYITTGGNPKSQAGAAELLRQAKVQKIPCDSVNFSARLPLATQDSIVARMLRRDAPLNIVVFEKGTVVPAGKNENEHMHSFDCAYRLLPAREWLFRQRK